MDASPCYGLLGKISANLGGIGVILLFLSLVIAISEMAIGLKRGIIPALKYIALGGAVLLMIAIVLGLINHFLLPRGC